MKSRKAKIIRSFLYNRFSERLTRKTQQWIYDHKNDPELDEVMRDAWNSIDILDSPSTLRSLRETKKRIGPPMFNTRRKIVRWSSAAAAVVVSALFVVSLHLYDRSMEMLQTNTVECIVPAGEIRRLTLPDGSVVSLNAGSVLIYPEQFNSRSRSVYLSGEGFFDVFPDKSKPFTVRTAHMNITAKGTTFNVHAYPANGKVAATLNTGEIEVNGNDEKEQFNHTVLPGQQVEYDSRTGNVVRRSVNPDEIIGWREGYLIFSNHSLAQIIPALERRFGVDIRVNADIDQEERYTLKFTNGESLEYIISILAQAAGDYRYSIDAESVNLYSNKNGSRKGGALPR